MEPTEHICYRCKATYERVVDIFTDDNEKFCDECTIIVEDEKYLDEHSNAVIRERLDRGMT